jgi:putative spermidine/putrescine transport system permease protein
LAEPTLDEDTALAVELAGPAGGLDTRLLDGVEPAGPTALAASAGRRRREMTRHVVALAPFSVYTTLFLLVPAVYILVKAFQDANGNWSLANFRFILFSSSVYRDGFRTSLELSLLAAVIPAVVGLLIAYAVHSAPSGSPLRRGVIAVSGIFSQFGGVPLAFMFIAAIGPGGLATGWLGAIGIHISSSFLSSFWGVAFVYMYFQIPLMVLVTMPALEALRSATREAAHNLGARSFEYWRYVGGPVLLPSFLGSVLLLFCFALAAYATAYALTSDTIALTPVQIGDFLNGNSIVGQQSVAYALGLGMLVLLIVVMLLYSFLQRRVSRWQR